MESLRDPERDRGEEREDSRKEEHTPDWFFGNLRDCAEFLTVCWAFLMLVFFPLYAPDGYHDIGGYKFSFFSGVSTLMLVPAALLALVCFAADAAGWLRGRAGNHREKERKKDGGRRWSCLDAAVLLYAVCCLVSWCVSDFPDEAWVGAGGWNMGLRTQLLMLSAYFLISRFFPWKKGTAEKASKSVRAVMAGALIGSGLTFGLGVLHRFQIDPLGLYKGIDSSYKIYFLSVIGQATWYSSYVCTVLPMGLCLFWASRSRRVRLVTGAYCVLGFMTLVTQNSDSAFAALTACMLGLFAASVSMERLERFWQVWLLCALSFKTVGFFQWLFPERAMQLGTLSTAFSRGMAGWLFLLTGASGCLWVCLRQMRMGKRKAGRQWEKKGGQLRWTAFLAAACSIGAAILLVVLNTGGWLERWFGFTINNSYLFFNDAWGNNRGFNWKFSVDLYRQLPWLNKLFGVGPDCFAAYSYSVPEYAARLNAYWRPDILTNAHNEYLNLLICVGLAGLFSFCLILAAACVRFLKISVHRPLVLTGALTVLAYGAHNFFCYQQVCCTPFLFLILGLTEGLVRAGTGEETEKLIQ